jgi:hypothetical protein
MAKFVPVEVVGTNGKVPILNCGGKGGKPGPCPLPGAGKKTFDVGKSFYAKDKTPTVSPAPGIIIKLKNKAVAKAYEASKDKIAELDKAQKATAAKYQELKKDKAYASSSAGKKELSKLAKLHDAQYGELSTTIGRVEHPPTKASKKRDAQIEADIKARGEEAVGRDMDKKIKASMKAALTPKAYKKNYDV